MAVVLPVVYKESGFSFKDFVLKKPKPEKVPRENARLWKYAGLKSFVTLPYWLIAAVSCCSCFVFFCFPFLFPLALNILSVTAFMYVVAARYAGSSVTGELFVTVGKSLPSILLISLMDYVLLAVFFGIIALIYTIGHISDLYELLVVNYGDNPQPQPDGHEYSLWGVRTFSFILGCCFGCVCFVLKAFAMPLTVLGRVSAFRAVWYSVVAVKRNIVSLWSCMLCYSVIFSLLMLMAVNTLFLILTDGFTLYLSIILQAVSGYVSENLLIAGLSVFGIIMLPVLTFVLTVLWPGFYYGGQTEAGLDIFWSHVKKGLRG